MKTFSDDFQKLNVNITEEQVYWIKYGPIKGRRKRRRL